MTFDGALVAAWMTRAAQEFTVAAEQLDALNVFPVPDGDTGTNLRLSIAAAAKVTEDAGFAELSGPEAMKTLARAAMLGARGNSGVITSQLILGLSQVFNGQVPTESDSAQAERSESVQFALGLTRASELAYAAVAAPREGTILTVSRQAAEAATNALRVPGTAAAFADLPVELVCRAAVDAAIEAVEHTPEQLPVLKQAGVVDAGGAGLLLLLDCLRQVIEGEPVSHANVLARFPAPPTKVVGSSEPSNGSVDQYRGPAYEVMCVLNCPDDSRIPGLKSTLAQLGDSLVVVGADHEWNIHVHVDDAGAAIEAVLAVGQPSDVKITWLFDHPEGGEHPCEPESKKAASSTVIPASGGADGSLTRTVVAVGYGAGVCELLAESGVTVVRATASARPSVADLMDGITANGAREIIVLPSDSDTQIVAETAKQHARESGLRVAVVPTRSIVQTLAAIAVHDPDADFDDDLAAMGRASAETNYGAVTVAVKDAITTAGTCHPGDILGLIGGDIAIIGSELTETIFNVIDTMAQRGGELITVVLGEGCTEQSEQQWLERVANAHPHHDLDVIEGGQQLWPVIVGVE